MASSSSRRRLEGAHACNNIGYGNVGAATFDEESHEWSFQRQIDTGSLLSSSDELGSLQASTAFPFRLVDEEPRDVLLEQLVGPAEDSISTQARLLRVYPELGLIADSEPLLTSDPAGTPAPPNSHSPVGELFGFGHAIQLDQQREGCHASIPIAALAVGKSAESVKLVRLAEMTANSHHHDALIPTMKVPTIKPHDQAWWTGRGDPVLQICFAGSHGLESTWMAIRQRSGTTILHPLLHRRPVPSRSVLGSIRTSKYPPSRLDANPAVTLPVARTGGAAHADVAFQPLNRRAFAVVDENGTWSTWQISGHTIPTSDMPVGHFKIALLTSGSCMVDAPLQPSQNTFRTKDAWHRISWSRGPMDTSLMLVFSRRTCTVYSEAGDLLGHVDVRLGPLHDRQTILDVKSGKLSDNHTFVLTSSRLLLLSTDVLNDGVDGKDEMVNVVFSWAHFRNRLDRTLRLSIIECASGVTALIHSQRTSLVTALRMEKFTAQFSQFVCIGGPCHFELFEKNTTNGPSIFIALSFHEIEFAPINSDQNLELRMYKLFAQDTNLKVTEYLYQYIGAVSAGAESFSDQALPLPSPAAQSWRESRNSDADMLEDFVVPDDHISTKDSPSLERSESRRDKAGDAATTDLSDIYEVLTELRASEASRDVVDELRDSYQVIQSIESSKHVRLLSDIIPPLFETPNIEKASAALDTTLVAQPMGQEQRLLQSVQLPLHGAAPASVLDHYNAMLTTWITPLSSNIPARIRVNRERRIRKIAADLTLSSVTLRHSPQESTQAKPGPASQAEPTEMDMSYIMNPLISSDSTRPVNQGQSALQRLQTYTSVIHPPQPPPTTSQQATLSSILAHLPTSLSNPTTSNPDSYSYATIESNLSAATRAQALARLDERDRRKVERRREKERRREEAMGEFARRERESRRVPAVRTETGVRSQELPFRGGVMSSPRAGNVEVGSSGGGAIGVGAGSGRPREVATQPEPGPHGARKVRPLKPKTPRVKGF